MKKIKEVGILLINQKAKKIKGCIRFDKGSANFKFPKEFLPLFGRLIKELKQKYLHYSLYGGEKDLKSQIVGIEARNGRDLSPKEIVITHGGMANLFLIFSLLLRPGDEIITNKYCFEGFSVLADYFHLIHKKVNLSCPKELEEGITKKTKLIVLNSPENPTGKVYSKEEIEEIVELAKKNKIWILSHEETNTIVYPPSKWCGPDLKYEKVIITNSFSKFWLLPGLRIGWICAKNTRLLENIARLINFQTLGVNIFDQVLITQAIKIINYDSFIKKRLEILKQRKELLEKELKKFGFSYFPVQGGINFYVDLKQDTQKLLPKALKHKVAFVPGFFFEEKKSTFARIGFGDVKKYEIKKGIKILFLLTSSNFHLFR